MLAVAPSESLTATIMGAVMSYVLAPEGSGTRLLLKIVAENERWYLPALAVGDLPMARRQLRVLKDAPKPAPPTPGSTLPTSVQTLMCHLQPPPTFWPSAAHPSGRSSREAS